MLHTATMPTIRVAAPSALKANKGALKGLVEGVGVGIGFCPFSLSSAGESGGYVIVLFCFVLRR